MPLHLTLLGLFVVAQIGVGLWIGRRVRALNVFFVAGRRLPAVLVFATILAANIGAGSTVNAAALGYRFGLSAWWWNGAAGLGTIILGLWVGPRLWAMAREGGFLTLGDLLESRYGERFRTATSLLIWGATHWILAAQLIGAGWILHVVTGLPREAGAMVGGLVMVLYFVAGGLLGSAWVNLVQLAVLLAGFILALPPALASAGGWRSFETTAGLDPGYTSLTSPDAPWLSLAVLLVPAFIVSPGLVQKAYGAENERAVRVGVTAAGVALLGFGFIPPLLGMAARVYHPGLPAADLALPTLMVEALPPLLGALALAAVFAAEVSSADAILFMLATSFGQDIYKGRLRPSASDAQVLRVARGAAIVGGGIGILLALQVPAIVDALKVFYSVLTVALCVPVLLTLLPVRAARAAAHASLVAGLVAMVATYAAGGDAGVGGWSPAAAGLAASAVGGFVAIGLGARS